MRVSIAVLGSVVADIVVSTSRLPRSGENMHVQRVQAMTGGKATNAAVAFTRLGGRAFLLGQTGDDMFARQARQDLQAEGVDISGLQVDPTTPTGAGILLVESSGHTAFMIDPGANQTLSPQLLARALAPLLPRLDGLLINFEAPESCLLQAVAMARAHDVPVFVDAGPARPYSPEIWRQAAVLSPNQAETEAMVGYAIASDEAAEAAARELLAQGPQAVVLKLDARGALWASGDQVGRQPALSIRLVDSAGSGDAFTAGLVLALLQGVDLAAAVRFANACGAVAASRAGTMIAMPRMVDVQQLLPE